MKKVLLVVIDALASRVVRPAMEQGRLPNLQALADAGTVDWNSTAIFPSITPAATAALITGGYPCDTGISGAYFFDLQDDHVHYYGDDIWAILRRGFSEFFEDFVVRLNRDQLRCETAFETAEGAGLRAACLNYLWFRGTTEHTIHVPWLLRLWPGVPWKKVVPGPAVLSLGDFVSGRTRRNGKRLTGPGGPFRRFGFDDEATTIELLRLANDGGLPEFTVAYFPDNDFNSHESGPQQSLETVEKVDEALGQLAATYGGMPAMLEQLAVVVTGDHAQSDLPLGDERTGIHLDKLLDDYTHVPAGHRWNHHEQMMVCPNMRAAQIYLRPGYWSARAAIVGRLLEDARIDQVLWREGSDDEPSHYYVETARHERLRFRVATSGETREGETTAQDEYGNLWAFTGDLRSVDAQVSDDGQLVYGDYPNALERIATSFDDQVSGDLWITCRLGHEFRIDNTSIHSRGSHGSLHAEDSLSPLILAGVPQSLWPASTPRSVDVAPLCLTILGITPTTPPGTARAAGKTRGVIGSG